MRIFKFFMVIAIVIGLLIYGIFYLKNYLKFAEEQNDLGKKIAIYYEKSSANAADRAIILSRPYITDEMYGRYSQRFDAINRNRDTLLSNLFHSDSNLQILENLGFKEFKHWAILKLLKDRGLSLDNVIILAFERQNEQDINKILMQTPRQIVVDMHQELQMIMLLRQGFYDEDFGEKELVKARERFIKYQASFEEALSRAEKWRREEQDSIY